MSKMDLYLCINEQCHLLVCLYFFAIVSLWLFVIVCMCVSLSVNSCAFVCNWMCVIVCVSVCLSFCVSLCVIVRMSLYVPECLIAGVCMCVWIEWFFLTLFTVCTLFLRSFPFFVYIVRFCLTLIFLYSFIFSIFNLIYNVFTIFLYAIAFFGCVCLLLSIFFCLLAFCFLSFCFPLYKVFVFFDYLLCNFYILLCASCVRLFLKFF